MPLCGNVTTPLLRVLPFRTFARLCALNHSPIFSEAEVEPFHDDRGRGKSCLRQREQRFLQKCYGR
jgi:hypothetical protein